MKLAIILLLITNVSIAAPALGGDRYFQNNDGTYFTGSLKGNEWFSYVVDKQGNIIKYNPESKNYEYANIVKVNGINELVPNGITASDDKSFAASPSNSSATNQSKANNETLKEQIGGIFNRYQKNSLYNMINSTNQK